ncbi:MAG: signal peptidase II [Verrucomicrobiales bacterium]
MIRYLTFLTLPLYLLDQITKILVLRRFPPPDELGNFEEIEVVPGFFWLHRLHNTGVAFGRFNEVAYSNLIFGAVSVVALIAIVIMWAKNTFPTRLGQISAALLMAGILGNLTDRVWHGYVVDFLKFDLKFMVWPSFNVADSCICVAAVFLFLSAWQKTEATTEKVAG